MYLNNLEFYSGSGYKLSGFIKKWKEKLLVFDLNSRVVLMIFSDFINIRCEESKLKIN